VTYYPVALHLFSKLQQHSTLAFFADLPHLTKQCRLEIALQEAGHPLPTKLPKDLGDPHQPQLTADAITIRTKARLMLVLVKQLLPLVRRLLTMIR